MERNAKMMQAACSDECAYWLTHAEKNTKSSHALENFFPVTHYAQK